MSQSSVVAEEVELPGVGARSFLAGLLVAGLVGGAWFVSDRPDNAPYEGASELISQLYAAGGAEFAAAWEPRAFDGVGLTPAEAPEVLDGFLATAGEPVGETVVMIAGVPIVRVDTSEGASWCVRPDGRILPLCFLGDLEVQVDAGELGGEAEVLGASLSLTQGIGTTFLVHPQGSDIITLSGDPVLSGNTGTWVLDTFDQVVQGQAMPHEPGLFEFGDVNTLGVVLTGELVDGILPAASFDIVVGEHTVHVTIPRPTYWLD